MPSPRNHEPKKVYFKPSEALLILHCSKYQLRALTAAMGKECGRQGGKGWRRYSVNEINQMTKLRYELYSNTRAGQLCPETNQQQQGNGSFKTKMDAVPEGENRPEFRGVDNER